MPRPNQYGGPVTQRFGYDGLYRLTSATGRIQTGSRVAHTYSLGMQYDAIHNITRKTQLHQVLRDTKARTMRGTSYDWAYAYNPSGPDSTRPHAPIHIGERAFTYDANGNQTGWTHDKRGTRRNIDWDEENRIRAIHDPGQTLAFRYDDQGQRTQKKGQRGETTYVSQFYTVKNGAITSKHIYAGKSRIVTRLITAEHAQTSRTLDGETTASFGTLATESTTGTAANDPGTADPAPDATGTSATTTDATATKGKGYLRTRQGFTGGNPGKGHTKGNGNGQAQAKNPTLSGNHPGRGQERCREVSGQHGQGRGCDGNKAGTHNPHLIGGDGSDGNDGGSNTGGSTKKATSGKGADFLYYYHPDHLGSSSYVTDAKGEIYEHIAYFPFGETWLEQATSRNRIAYKYTSKELDSETGLYYYGARYYDPRTSVWQSADPIIGEYLEGNPGGGVYDPQTLALYSYASMNPVKFIDPDGLATQLPKILERAILWTSKKGKNISEHVARHTRAIVRRDGRRHSVFRTKNQVRKLAIRAMKKPHSVVRQGKRIRVEAKFSRPIGTRGEKAIRIVLDASGKVITTYPIKTLSSTAGAAGLLFLSAEASAEQALTEASRSAQMEAKASDNWATFLLDLVVPGGINAAGTGEGIELAIHRGERRAITSAERALKRKLTAKESAAVRERYWSAVNGSRALNDQ